MADTENLERLSQYFIGWVGAYISTLKRMESIGIDTSGYKVAYGLFKQFVNGGSRAEDVATCLINTTNISNSQISNSQIGPPLRVTPEHLAHVIETQKEALETLIKE